MSGLALCLSRNRGGCKMDFQKELIAEYDRETVKTRKILDAIPADADFTFKPHPKSMALGRVAGHISETAGDWALHALTVDKLEFPADHKFEGYIPASKEALLERFDKDTAKVKAELAKFAPSKWDDNWKFVAGGQARVDEPKTFFLGNLGSADGPGQER